MAPQIRASSTADSSKKPARSRLKEPFGHLYSGHLAIPPPFSYKALDAHYDASDVLQSAIAAMEVNIAAFGLNFVPAVGEGGIPEAQRPEAEEERKRLAAWFRFASGDLSFAELRRRTRVDLEVFGDGYWEVLRDLSGKLVGIEHARTFWMRKAPLDPEPVEVQRWARRGDGTWERRPTLRRFRRFVQVVNGVETWFKEFGDPRPVRASTGKVDTEIAPADAATEILNFSLYAPSSAYGKPRWRGAVADIVGRTAASETNADVFDNNAIPPVAVLVQNATLAAGTTEVIRQHFASVRGRENRHAVLVLEAENAAAASPTGDLPAPPARIDIKELRNAQGTDGQFTNYREQAADAVGLTFRLPPIFLGRAKEYNRATADAARFVGEEQVFAPERAVEDEIINRTLLPELGARFWEVHTEGPPLLSEETLVQLVEAGVRAGALSPEQVAQVLNPLLAVEVVRKEPWAKLPTIVLEALVKAGWTLDAAGLTKPEPRVEKIASPM